MSISTTYNADLSRVQIVCAGVHADANHALIERSMDQITWTTVRGGSVVTLVGGACALDDYEFIPNTTNYYRATYVDTSDVTLVAEGTLSTANNGPVTPGLPAGVQDGDILVMMAAIRNTAGAPSTPTGWFPIADVGNFKVFTRVYAAGVTAPTVTFTGGVANADTAARIVAMRNASFSVLATTQSNSSAQDIAHPSVAPVDIKPNRMLAAVWKQATSTGATMPDWTLISRNIATAGDDETIAWWHKFTDVTAPSGTITVTGGVAAVSKVAILRFSRKEFIAQETDDITPNIDRIWIKNIQRPFLNREITLVGQSEQQRSSRSALFDIVSRSDGIAVTELRGSPRFSISIKTETVSEADDFDLVLSVGDVVFIQTPPGCPRPLRTGYYLIGDTNEGRGTSIRSPRRYFTLPLTRCAAPNPTLVGTTVTWQGVINAFATWTELIAAEPTWADVLTRIDEPSDVVVP